MATTTKASGGAAKKTHLMLFKEPRFHHFMLHGTTVHEGEAARLTTYHPAPAHHAFKRPLHGLLLPSSNCPTSSQSLLKDKSNCRTVLHSRPFYVRCSEGPIGDLDDKHMLENLAQVDEFTLEARLQAAVESENYVVAAQLRDQLRVLQEDSKAGVRAANAKFYKAFELSDLKGMRDIWACGDYVHCIHPGAGRISGYDMVIASWELMLSPDVSLPLKIELHNLEVQVKGNIGYVTCLEVVRTSGSSWGKQLATNIFEKQNGIWFLCMHHASHITL